MRCRAHLHESVIMAPDVLALDLNGTLLDLSALDPHFARAFGSADRRERWFSQLQVLCLTSVATDNYEPFDKLAKAALRLLAAKEGKDLAAAAEKAILSQVTRLPPFPDVREALERLKTAGRRLVALTNGTPKTANAQLKHAGLHGLFEEVLSADEVGRYKPAREPYLLAAETMKVKPRGVLMVAAHGWDLAGAAAAGLRTAFVTRPGEALDPDGPKPDHVATDLRELVERVLR